MRKVLLHRAEEGGWVVTCPSLPGCVSEGETMDEARTNIREAIDLYIEDMIADGEPVPEDWGETILEAV